MPELGQYGSVRGVSGNGHSYRDWYYPTAVAEQPVARGRLTILMAPQEPPAPGNGRLMVVWHGSGGAPWVHVDLARAIDAVGLDGRFGPALDLARVGVCSMSAGGHTALSLARGRCSPAGFHQHGETHLAEDFQACVGLRTRLTGGPLAADFDTWPRWPSHACRWAW